MTACVNKNHGRRVAGVVTASLVGALTLGGVSLAAVPTVALAEQGSLQAVSPMEQATLRKYTVNGNTTEYSATGNYVELKVGQSYLEPKTATIAGYGEVDLTDADFTVTYYESDGTTKVGGNGGTGSKDEMRAAKKNDGDTYVAKVEKTGSDNDKYANINGTAEFTFKYVAKASEDTYAVGTGAGTTASPFKKGLTYNGTDQASDVMVRKNDGSISAPASFEDSVGDTTTKVDHAGSYTAVLTDGTKVPFTVAQLDLSKAAVTADDVNKAYADSSAFVASLDASVNSAVKVKSVTGPKGNHTFSDGAGEYAVVLAPLTGSDETDLNNASSDDVTGEATVKFTVYQKKASIGYDGVTGTTIGVDVAFGGKYDEGRFYANYDGKNYRNSELTFTYKDKDGNRVSASDMKDGETYEVTVRMNPVTVKGSVVGGSETFKVSLNNSALDANEALSFSLDGKPVNGSATVDYDGSNALDKLTVTVKDADGKVYKQGTDFTLVAYKGVGTTGDELTEAVDVDTYTVFVKPSTFKWVADGDAQLKLTISQVRVASLSDYKDVKLGTDPKGNDVVDRNAVLYTGSDIATPAPRYVTKYKDVQGTPVSGTGAIKVPAKYAELPADTYTVASISYKGADGTDTAKTVDSIKDAGVYTVSIAATDKGSKNFNLGDFDYDVVVKKAESFTDVAADAWYAKGVMNAYNNYYVNGISGTTLFAPEADITRADAAVILFNMAGGSSLHGDDEFSYSDQFGYDTGFSDVDGHAYYAKAIAWAKAAGVATGDAGTTSFRPTDKISRQEFAALLVKYAKSTGKYVAPAEDALSKVSDAGTVDAWAKDAVNWAVANKVMGNGGYVAGRSEIKRAEVATMGVNFQPKSLTGYNRLTNPKPVA